MSTAKVFSHQKSGTNFPQLLLPSLLSLRVNNSWLSRGCVCLR